MNAAGQDLGHERSRLQDLLKVIQDQQQAPVAQGDEQSLKWRVVIGFTHTERVGNRRSNERGVANRTERNPGYPMREIRAEIRRKLYEEARARRMNELVATLRAQAKVEVSESALEKGLSEVDPDFWTRG